MPIRDEGVTLQILSNCVRTGNMERVVEIIDGCDKKRRDYFRLVFETIRPNFLGQGKEVQDRLDRTIQVLSQ